MDVAKNMEKLNVFCSSKSNKKIMMDTSLANLNQKNMKETEKIGPYPPNTEETLKINRRRTPHSKFFPKQHMQTSVLHTNTSRNNRETLHKLPN